MIIGVDGNEANVRERVGVSVYTLKLLKHFNNQARKDLRFIIYLRDDPRNDFPVETEFFQYKVIKSPVLWRDIFLPINLYVGERPDVFFAPAHYTPRFCPVPTVVTIHDLAYEYFPNEFLKKDLIKLKNWTRQAVDHAKKIIAVSKNTKEDIIKIYKVPEEKIELIYNGFSKFQITNSKFQIKSKFQILNSKFILYVGTLQPRKNISTLIDAFNQLINEGEDLKLVIAGKKGWMYNDIFTKVEKLKLEDKVIFTGYLEERELTNLYKHAQVFVMPSLYEGFCIPVLEAMNYSCPVIASNTSSLPEIGVNACLYFNPNDKIDLKDKVLRILRNPKLKQTLIRKGKEGVKNFSWEKCCSETLDLLKENVS